MRILIGYDGSESADAALADLRHAGLPRDAEALILSVADVMRMPALSRYELVEQALVSRRLTSGIFVGSRNFNNALERFRLGSVSTALVTSAPCSVEVVR